MNDEKKPYSPTVVSIFSGCGGLDLGFHMEGYETIWANDFAEWAVKSFARNFGDVIKYGDITQINPYTDKTIPDCDLVLGGFPCQDFSIIWKQPGLNGKRGGLFRHFAEFVDAKKPKAFVAENVKGLITANKGKAIETIVKDFESIAPGYVVKPHLYNFAEYGVPQFRERVLFVGIRIDTGFDFVHPKPTHGPNASQPYFTSGQALKDVEKVPDNNEKINIKEKTRKMLELIPEGGNFKDVPKDKLDEAIHKLVKDTIIKHKRVIFNGNGYTQEWVDEAEKRGLFNLKSTPDAMPALIAEKNKKLFAKHHIYTKTIHIEALTLEDMVLKQFAPALMKYIDELTQSALSKKQLGIDPAVSTQTELIKKLSSYYEDVIKATEKLAKDVAAAEAMEADINQAKFYHDTVIADMEEIRKYADQAEPLIPEGYLPYPTYEQMLFYV